MKVQRFTCWLCCALFILATSRLAVGEENPESITVGMIDSLFDGGDEESILTQIKPFSDLVSRQTGIRGEFAVINGVEDMAQGLQDGGLGLGVVHGIEYVWLKKLCPDARALVVAAVYNQTQVKAQIIVAQDNPSEKLTDLKGKTIAVTQKIPIFARRYLEQLVGAPLEQAFKPMVVTNNNQALEAVIRGDADLSLASSTSVASFQALKGPRYNLFLKSLEESIDFPLAVVVYRPGLVKQETVRKFQESLLTAHQNTQGRQTLNLWKLDGFRKIPEGYDKIVEGVAKQYPQEAAK